MGSGQRRNCWDRPRLLGRYSISATNVSAFVHLFSLGPPGRGLSGLDEYRSSATTVALFVTCCKVAGEVAVDVALLALPAALVPRLQPCIRYRSVSPFARAVDGARDQHLRGQETGTTAHVAFLGTIACRRARLQHNRKERAQRDPKPGDLSSECEYIPVLSSSCKACLLPARRSPGRSARQSTHARTASLSLAVPPATGETDPPSGASLPSARARAASPTTIST